MAIFGFSFWSGFFCGRPEAGEVGGHIAQFSGRQHPKHRRHHGNPGGLFGNVGTGASWRQGLWVGCAMSPMSSVPLLLVSTFVVASPVLGKQIASIALPVILLMEVLGAVVATVAITRAGESSRPPKLQIRQPFKGPVHES